MKYLVLDNEENRQYKADLINTIIEGEKVGEYIQTSEGNFLAYNLKEVNNNVKRSKTNKTKIINSIKVYDNKEDADIKEVLRLKSLLRNRTVEDIESIEHVYNSFIKLYYLACIRQINYNVEYILKDAIKLILDSNVNLNNSYELQEIKRWINLNVA